MTAASDSDELDVTVAVSPNTVEVRRNDAPQVTGEAAKALAEILYWCAPAATPKEERLQACVQCPECGAENHVAAEDLARIAVSMMCLLERMLRAGGVESLGAFQQMVINLERKRATR